MNVSSLMLYALDVSATAGFYRLLGADLNEPSSGRVVGDVGGCRLAIVGASSGDAAGPGVAGTAMPGFAVDAIDDVVASVKASGRRVLRDVERLDWGRRAVVSDPDGRAVEIVQYG